MSGLGAMGGAARGSRGPRAAPAPSGPTKEIGCKCGYSCGTMKALEKHLDKFKGNPAHEAKVTERPASPPRPPRDFAPDGIDDELLAQLGGAAGLGGLGGLDARCRDYPRGAPFADISARQTERGPAASGGGADVELGCICG